MADRDRDEKVDYEARARKLAPLLANARAQLAAHDDQPDDQPDLHQPTPVMPARRRPLDHFRDAQRVTGYTPPAAT